MDWHVESRPSIVNLAHIKEVGAREATHGGESIAQVLSQSADNLVPPLRGGDSLGEGLADVEIERDQILIDGEDRFGLGLRNVVFEVNENLGVVGGEIWKRWWDW